MATHIRTYAPGFGLLVAAGVLAVAIASLSPLVNALVVAVFIGAVLGNLVDIPEQFEAGIGLRRLFLETGIVLLGVSVALPELLTAGPRLLAIVLGTVAFGLVVVESIGRVVFGLTDELPSLLAAGSSICGVSAVVAVGRVIGARDGPLALAAGTVLFFDAVTLVLFPIVGRALSLSSVEFGVWAGLSMFSTGPVAAAGFAYSPEAGQWATVTKLVRNSLLGLVAIGYSIVAVRFRHTVGTGTKTRATDPSVTRLWRDFPKFLVGFVLLAVVANTGVLTASSIEAIGTVTDWLFVLAFVGLGTTIRLSTMRDAGGTPVAIVLVYLLIIASVSLVAVKALF